MQKTRGIGTQLTYIREGGMCMDGTPQVDRHSFLHSSAMT